MLLLRVPLHSLSVREGLKQLKKDYERTEDDLKALQSVGQIIGEVLRQLDEEKCMTSISYEYCAHINPCMYSYCEGLKWS